MSGRSSRARLSEDAEADFIDILLHGLETWGERQMNEYSSDLVRALSTIANNPRIGRPRDDIRKGLRSYLAGHHQIYYRIIRSEPIVARILHERMDPRRHIA